MEMTRFDDDKTKTGSARRVMSDVLPNTNCFTLEASFFMCKEKAKTREVYGQSEYRLESKFT